MKRFVSLICASGILIILCSTYASAQTCGIDSCHQPGLGSLKPHSPVKENDCAACHQRTNKQHPLKGEKSFQLTAKVPVLCSQCHDPFGKEKVAHQPVKEGDCLSCHNPHGASGRFLLDVNEDRTNLCIKCHDSTPFKQKFMHGPVAVGACAKCHAPHEAPEKNLLYDPARTQCLKCHTNFDKSIQEAPVVHSPVKGGSCSSCHNPHGSSVAKMLKKKMPDLCVECHIKIGKKLGAVKVPHMPIQQEGSCISCHAAHYSKEKRLLPFDEMTTCLNCHDKDKMGTPPLRNIKKELAGKKYLHGPLETGQCQACHDPHGSDDFRMLRGSYPAETYAPYKEGIYGACLGCHEKNLLKFADTTLYTGFRNGSRNLHYVHVVNNRKGRTCRVCHEPHASNSEKMISKEGTKFGDWKIPINFTVTSTGGSCAPGCHRAFKYDRQKPENYQL